jgi:hypothetical protein
MNEASMMQKWVVSCNEGFGNVGPDTYEGTGLPDPERGPATDRISAKIINRTALKFQALSSNGWHIAKRVSNG